MNITQLLNTKAGKKLANEYQAEQDQERTDLFTELDVLRKKRDASLPGLNRALSKATADCVELTSKLESAKIRERTATAKLQQAKSSHASHVVLINKELMKSAPPEIDKFCESLHEEAHHLRSNAITSPFDSGYTQSVNARATAIRETITEANKLKLVAGDIRTSLEQLHDALPAVKKTH